MIIRAVLLGGLTLACAALSGGCVSCFKKSETYVAYDDDGAAAYYRITLHGTGSVGDLEYRSGWYDARAVDSLFSDIEARRRMEQEAVKENAAAIKETLKLYLDALKDRESTREKIDRAKAAYERALETVSGLAPAGTTREDALFYADKKLVMTLSADPGPVLQAIKGRIQGTTLIESLRAKLKTQTESNARRGKLRVAPVMQQAEHLSQTLAAAEQSLDGSTNAKLRAALSKVLGEAESGL